MVYRRRLRRRFPRRIRRRYYRRNRTTFGKKVRRTLLKAAELKQATSTFNLNASNFYKTTLAPVNIPQGAGDNQRVGNVIMSRNWQLKLNFLAQAVQNPTPNDGIYRMRVVIVWPRKFSTTDAANAIGLSSFPLETMIDPDNWIIWYDKTFFFTFNNQIHPATKQTCRIVFNKRFYSRLDFGSSASTVPTKLPYLVWITDHPVTGFNWVATGYVKLSYKDV